jgi:hypothetical protein
MFVFEANPCSVGLFKMLLPESGLFSRLFERTFHGLPLVLGNQGIPEDDDESTERKPSHTSFPELVYLFASFLGVLILGVGWCYLVCNDGGGGIIVFVLPMPLFPALLSCVCAGSMGCFSGV